MMPIRENVVLPSLGRIFDDKGQIKEEIFNTKAEKLFSQLRYWAIILKEAQSAQPEKAPPVR
jgi:hypothetical protein